MSDSRAETLADFNELKVMLAGKGFIGNLLKVRNFCDDCVVDCQECPLWEGEEEGCAFREAPFHWAVGFIGSVLGGEVDDQD
jgi:hypothetical protein